MVFEFTDEQRALRTATRDFLADHFAEGDVRATMETQTPIAVGRCLLLRGRVPGNGAVHPDPRRHVRKARAVPPAAS